MKQFSVNIATGKFWNTATDAQLSTSLKPAVGYQELGTLRLQLLTVSADVDTPVDLSGYSGYEFAGDINFLHNDSLMLFSDSAGTANVPQITVVDAANGIIDINYNSTNAKFESATSSLTDFTGRLFFVELYAFSTGNTDGEPLLRDTMIAVPRVKSQEGAPESGDPVYLTQAQIISALAAKEDALGNPSADGMILASTRLGVRSWTTITAGDEFTSNKSTSITVDGLSDTKYPTVKAVKDYADLLVVGIVNDRGNYNASGNVFPSTGGSGTDGAILKGNLWVISGAGTLGGSAVEIGDQVRALSDTPGQTASNWAISQANISYVPENSGNKVTSISSGSTDTQYPSAKLVYDQLALKANANAPTITGVATFSSGGAIFTTTGNIGYNTMTANGVTGYMYQFGAGYTTSGRYLAASTLIDGGGAGGTGVAASHANGVFRIWTGTSTTEKWQVATNGNLSNTLSAGDGYITLKAGTTSLAPIVLTAGTNTTQVKAGALEFDGTNLTFAPTAAARKIITLDGLSNPMTTAGDIVVGGTNGVPARLAKGAALQVLRMNADATAHEYATMSGGITASFPSATNYTLQLSDAGTVIVKLQVATNSIIIPANSAVAFPIGTVIDVIGNPDDAIDVSGITLHPASDDGVFGADNQMKRLVKSDTDTWLITDIHRASSATSATVTVDSSGFTGNLTTAIETVQDALDEIDALSLGTGSTGSFNPSESTYLR